MNEAEKLICVFDMQKTMRVNDKILVVFHLDRSIYINSNQTQSKTVDKHYSA